MESIPVEPDADAPLIPIAVTSVDEPSTRRWQILLSSTGMRMCRPGHALSPEELPAIAVFVTPRDVWMSWALRDVAESPWREMAQELHAAADGWAERPNAPEHTPERLTGWKRWFDAMRVGGFYMPGYPGDVRWLRFTENGVDWRTVADSVALVVREFSRNRSGSAHRP